jgi:lysophospholipase L1-like esterase
VNRVSRSLIATLALLAVGVAWLGLSFHQWRAGKLALLDVPPARALATGTPASPASLLLFGDSRIAQWNPRPLRPYPMVVNGTPGASAIQLLPEFQAALARHRPALVLLQVGGNDAVAAALSDAAAARQAQADTRAAIDRMAAAARAMGARLVILEVMPPVRTDPVRRILFRDQVTRFIDELNAALPEIARRNGATFTTTKPLLAPDGEMPDRFRKDWLHLTPEAYRALDPLLPPTLDGPVPYSIDASTG